MKDTTSTTLRLDLPLEITVRIGAPAGSTVAVRAAASAAPARPAVSAGVPLAPEERFILDEDYDQRTGYDPSFLSGHVVPLPELTPEAMKLVSRDQTRDDPDNCELRYHHYSVVMNRQRRVAFFTACNTTRHPKLVGKKSRAELNGGARDKWILDPRIPAAHQIQTKELYGPLIFDRGHVVRREDVYWGDDAELAEYANFDSFHYTNCTPQHPEFNQSQQDGLWGKLENHIANECEAKDMALTLFAGPVLRPRDRLMRGVRIPHAFWKVVVAIRDDDTLGAWAFLLSQKQLVAGAEEVLFDPADFQDYQVSLPYLERILPVRFPKVVKDADVMKNEAPETLVELGGLEGVRLRGIG